MEEEKIMDYYFNIDGQNVGPLKADQIRPNISSGKITLQTLTWKQGMQQWAQVKEVAELIAAFPELQGGAYTPPPPGEGAQAQPQQQAFAGYQQAAVNYADFMPRFLAGLIDAAILFIPSIIVGMFIPLVGGFLVSIPYYVYFMSDYGGGQTIGYKAMKLKLLNEETMQPAPLAPIFLWYLVLSFAGFIGWIWFFTDSKRRMLHNIASKTIVISLAE